MANYLLSHTGAQIDEGIDAALNIDSTIANRIGSTGPAGCRNKIRNPRFSVNQRNVSGSVTLAAGAFGHDGWKAGASGCTYTFSTTQNRTTLTITAGSLIQTIDGNDLAAGVNTHTLSWGGTCQGKLGAGDYGASGLTGEATGGTDISVKFGTGTLYEPQFEVGTVASEFDCLPDGAELDRCQWYLPGVWASSSLGFIPANVHCISATSAKCTLAFPRPCRVSPTGLEQSGTFAIRDSSDITLAATLVFNRSNQFGCNLRADLASGLVAGDSGQLTHTSAFKLLFTGGEI